MTVVQAQADRASLNGGSRQIAVNGDLWPLKLQLADWLEAALKQKELPLRRTPDTSKLIRERIEAAHRHKKIEIPDQQRSQFMADVVDEVLGFGPLESLLADDNISEIMVNGPRQVYVERDGKVMLTNVRFADDDHVVRIINKIVRPLGRRVDARTPLVDARLPDGSRVNAVVPPCAIDGPSITIRKFSKEQLKIEDLINFGSLTPDMARFLEACVVSKLNIVIAGGTGSGKTTLLNVLSGFIPDGDRIVTIEDAAELSLDQSHVVRLETRHADSPEERSVEVRDLVRNSLRMRPERIVVGECRGGEALDMLQAMNTGHDGSLTTVHANTPRDTISRLETLVLMAGIEMPIVIVRKQIASAVQLIVQQARLRDGSRKVTQITEVAGMEGKNVVMQDIFKFEEQGQDSEGNVAGEFVTGGLRPYYSERLKNHGFKLPPKMFMKPRTTTGMARGTTSSFGLR
ncbi:MAG: CpaF family protein [Chloroflexota bacterium]